MRYFQLALMVLSTCTFRSTRFLRGISAFSVSSPLRTSTTRLYSSQSSLESKPYIPTPDKPSPSGYKPPSINWYPGHIAKAERTLSETLQTADVLIEVRDARIPKSTSHPKVREWTAGRPRIVVLTRVDMVPKSSVREWTQSWEVLGAGKWDGVVQDGNVVHTSQQRMAERGISDTTGRVDQVLFVDAKRGQGLPALHRSIVQAGTYVNERRKSRGLRDRPLRVAILGYPNVGKSALINRILGKKRAKSANTPGITRALQWIRVRGESGTTDEFGRAKRSKSGRMKGSGSEFELLDSPGIIPANMENQEDALLLAVCNSIGDGAYDNQGVAAYLCERLKTLYQMNMERLTAPVWREKCIDRYQFDPLEPMPEPTLAGETVMRIPTGEDMLFQVAENTCRGDPENAARKILQDFRNGRMGPICLQLAPDVERDEANESGQRKVEVLREVALLGEHALAKRDGAIVKEEEAREERAHKAVQMAKERGLGLPPMVEDKLDGNESNDVNESDVGKGLFDGW